MTTFTAKNMTDNVVLFSDFPTLEEAIKKVEPLDERCVVLGFAEDQNPVYLDVTDPVSSDILIWEDIVGQGMLIVKTAIEYIIQRQKNSIEFIFVSKKPSLKNLNEVKSSFGNAMVPFLGDKTSGFSWILFALTEWHKAKERHSPVVLFIDGIENLITLNEEDATNMRFILKHGREKGIYVVGTVDRNTNVDLSDWLGFFQGQIFGTRKLHWFETTTKSYKRINFFAPITGI